jgi:hypothetical protein
MSTPKDETVRLFRAFSPSGLTSHTIPNVKRIDSNHLRSGEWPNTKARQSLSEVDFAANVLRSESTEIACEYCELLAPVPRTYFLSANKPFLGGYSLTCGDSCYFSFIATHFSKPLTELRGPGPQGYGAFVKRGTGIRKGEWVGEYIGELRPIHRVNRDLERGIQSMYRFDFALENGGTVVVDSEKRGNWTRFINSSCCPNLDVWYVCSRNSH